MKENTHPKYQEVLFVDSSNGHKFVVGSTIQTDQMETFEGKKYPVVHVSISSSSHPFFVGGKKIIDTEGRVDRFTARYKKAAQKAAAAPAESDEAAPAQKQSASSKKPAAKKSAK